MNTRAPLPITLLSGFLGAGKTTVLGALLRQDHGMRIGVIVNDMAALNIDADVARTIMLDGAPPGGELSLVELQNGCICCSLREELVAEVARLARSGAIDYLLIESTGISEPLPVARAFSTLLPGETQRLLSDVAKIDTLVTVVDGENFLAMYRQGEPIAGDKAERTLSDLLVDQIEYANVLLVSKADRVPPDRVQQLVSILRTLNPSARILPSALGSVPSAELVGTGRFCTERMSLSPGWIAALQGEALPQSAEYGTTSFVWEARRPLHPQRFWDLLSSPIPAGELLRSKGFFWLASRHDAIGLYQQAGGTMRLEHAGAWWATMAPEQWPRSADLRHWIDRKWAEPHGDRRQEIVFIGRNLDESAWCRRWDACLLTDEELALGESGWPSLADPFPAWP